MTDKVDEVDKVGAPDHGAWDIEAAVWRAMAFAQRVRRKAGRPDPKEGTLFGRLIVEKQESHGADP